MTYCVEQRDINVILKHIEIIGSQTSTIKQFIKEFGKCFSHKT